MRTVFSKIIFTFITTIVALIPFWIWLGVYELVNPASDIARLIVVGFGLYFLGAIQLIILVGLAILLFIIWVD